MGTFADVSVQPGGIIAWLVVGLGVGCLAGLLVKGSGYGISVDIFLGLLSRSAKGF
jgi:uncharacterized membrane protein YeaQ/YmgE (transglycosylase-associated protein family)